MSSIHELLLRLPAVVETVIQVYSKNNLLFTLKDTMHNLQMSYYWLQQANKELNKADTDIVSEQPQELQAFTRRAPTLITPTEHFDYIKEQLLELTAEAKDCGILPPTVQYQLDRSYDRLMEALFNTETAILHYGELTRTREQQ